MDIPLDEVVYFDVCTHNPATGAVSDADSTPTFAVYEEATDTDIGVGGNLTKRTSLTGNYRGSFTQSSANGFEVGKFYNVIASATVNSIAGKKVVLTFRCVAAENIAGVPQADVVAIGGATQSATDLKDFADTGYDPSEHKVAGVVLADTVTTLTNLPAITSNWLTAAGLATDAVNEIRDAIWDNGIGNLTTTSSIGKEFVDGLIQIAELWNRLTDARAALLDNLNIGGNVASSAEVTSVQNNTRVVRVVPTIIERPDTGTQTYRIELLAYDNVGNMEAPDSAPTLDLVDQGGTDLSSRLDSATGSLVSTGRYRWVYTASDTDDLEQLVWTFSVVEGGNTRLYGNVSVIVDTTAVDFTAADRTKLEAIHTKLPSKSYLTGTGNSDGDIEMNEATGNFPGSVNSVVEDVGGKVLGGGSGTITGTGARVVDASGNNVATSAAQTTAQTSLNTIDGIVDDILVDTATTIPGTITTLQASVDAVPTAEENRTEMDTNSSKLAMITSERMAVLTDWINGGRLDLILDARASQSSVDSLWTTALTEAYRSTGSTGTAAQLLYELIGHLGNAGIVGTTKTLKKLDKSTTAKTYTLDDDTTPTAIEETT